MKKIAALVSAVGLLSFGCTTQSTPSPQPAQSAAAAPSPHYHVVRHIPVGGDGGWDYLTMDSPSHRLFISRGDRVVVLDVQSGKVVGEIPNTQGVHGIAIAPDLHRGFVSDGRTSTVTIFDLDSLKTLSEVKTTGDRPDAIIFDPASSRVFTFNAAGKNTTAIDAATGNIAGTVALGGKPEFAAADGKGHVYVNVEDTSELVALDSKALTEIKRWKLTPCEEPSGLAMDRNHRRLFSGCGNKLMAVSDPDAGRVVATVPIGQGVDANAFDPAFNLAFSSNGADGTLTVAHEVTPDQYEVADNVPTQRAARTMALDEQTHHIYLATAQFGPPPAPTPERPRPRPPMLPGTFEIVEVAP
jgi:DNA-binding beta-propeller fold protein YncE